MQFILDHPGMFVTLLACCWPAPIPLIIAVFLARRFDWRNPFTPRGGYDL